MLFYVGYLDTLSLSILQSAVDRMINERGGTGGMRIGRGKQYARRKPTAMPLCPAEIRNSWTWDRTTLSLKISVVFCNDSKES